MTVLTSENRTGAYIAWTSGAVEVDEVPYHFSARQRLRGDQPAVQHCSWAFVADGVPRSEWPDVRANDDEQAERERRLAEANLEVRILEPPALLDPAEYVRAKRQVRAGHGPNREGLPESVATIPAGAVLLRDQPVVEKLRSAFEDFELETKPKRRR